VRVEPENHSIRIEEIRNLKEEFSLKAFSDRPRAALVVPADRMTLQAANALLKTLEEPPPDTHLLLVAHRFSQVPLTIVSRCQKVPFSPLAREEVEAIVAAQPGIVKRHSPETVRAAAACAAGSPGRALALLEEMEEGRETWVRLLARLDPEAVFKTGEGWKRGTGEAAESIAVPLSLVRDLALLSSGGKEAIINEDLRDRLQALAARKAARGWIRALQTLLSLSRMPPQAQKRLALEAFLFDLHIKD
jgi:DNA polymerase-3 subunit delta'